MGSIGEYKILNFLGKGKYGEVYKAVNKANDVVALKIIQLDGYNNVLADTIRTDYDIVKELSENDVTNLVPKYYKLFKDVYNGRYVYVIVMEYLEGINLKEYYIKSIESGKVDYEFINKCIKIICSILEYINIYNVVHRDIKLDNIMYTNDGRVLLIDYGTACKTIVENTHKCATKAGTPNFMAPEIFKYTVGQFRRINALYILKKCDIWSLGICMWILSSLKFPYKAKTLDDLKMEILESDAPSRLDINTGVELQDRVHEIINDMLDKKFKSRPSPTEILNKYY